MLFDYFKICKNYLDYLPLVLITVLFVAESELELHALNTSCQIAITVITLVIFYMIVMRFKNTKMVALIIAIIVWITLIYIKKRYIPN
jgi:hypothetical protein